MLGVAWLVDGYPGRSHYRSLHNLTVIPGLENGRVIYREHAFVVSERPRPIFLPVKGDGIQRLDVIAMGVCEVGQLEQLQGFLDGPEPLSTEPWEVGFPEL